MGLFDLTPDQNDQLLGMAMGLLSQSGPSTAPRPLGAAFGAGIQGLQQAKQAGQARQMTQLQAQLLGLQGQQMKTAMDRDRAWYAMMGLPDPSALTPPAPTVQAQQSPDVPPGVAPAVNPGTPSQVAFTAGRMGVPPPSTQAPGANLPDDVRRMIGMLGPEKGGAMLAQYQMKNTERGQYVPETITVNGTPIPGQRDRLSGKFEPYNPNIQGAWAPEERKMPGPNGQMVTMPGQKNNLTGEWKPLDPSLTRLTVQNNIGPANEGSKAAWELAAKSWQGQQQAVVSNNRMEGDLTNFETAMKSFKPGADAGIRLKAQQYMNALGLPSDNTGQGELMLRSQRAIELANTPKGQGQITENERVLIREVNNLMGSTPDGAEMLIAATRQLNAYDAKVEKIYRESARKNGGAPNPVEVADGIEKLGPALDPALQSRLQSAVKGNPGAGGSPAPAPAPAAPKPAARYVPGKGLVINE